MTKKLVSISLFIIICLVALEVFIAINWRSWLQPIESKPPSSPVAVVVPHHDWAKEYRLEFWQVLQQKTSVDFSTIHHIIIIGPDHFGAEQAGVTYATDDFSMANGVYTNDFGRPDYFNDAYVAGDSLVKQDHAVSSLIGELQTTFPDSDIAAFLIGQQTSFSTLTPLREYINKNCHADCLLVASVDFTHFQPRAVIEMQDERTISQLATMTISETMINENRTAIYADSPQSLYVLQETARANHLTWWLQNHTISAKDDVTTDTTSHVFGAYLPK
jgi:poly-gamma-glutamate synthesis protein (capsule biosynthesis protein)